MTSRERAKQGPLSDPHNRNVLAVLNDAGGPLHVNELAERLVRRDETVIPDDEYDGRLERELISLHHDSLPRLADAGLVDYDRETKTASSRTDASTEVDWLDGDVADQALRRVLSAPESDGDSVGVLEGRRAAIERGRALADEAEEELFCMYVDTSLLEDDCIRHAEDAIDRGVEMYVGSRNPDVLDLARRRLPEATLWEPQRGWLDSPSGYPKVGRLVLVDRRKVMLAVLDEPGPDGDRPEETAMVGDGEDNPLVVLVRELLGPRLDHLDYQSADFQSELYS